MKILIIDDDRFLTNAISNSLNKNGYSVKVINKSKDMISVEKIIEKYDLVLLDLMMRKPEGLEVNPGEETGEALYKLIKKMDKNKPVIIITGKDSMDIKTKFHKDETQVLLKPLSSRYEDLYGAIKNVH